MTGKISLTIELELASSKLIRISNKSDTLESKGTAKIATSLQISKVISRKDGILKEKWPLCNG
ncbi:6738_t:CDS:2 [Entrophospora sp. SA101]|nr:6738_t:CDS:2 [Entrophospora sp. SA101]